MAISGCAILFHMVQVYFEMKKEGLGFVGYLKSLVTMGRVTIESDNNLGARFELSRTTASTGQVVP